MFKGDVDDNFQAVNELEDNDNLEDKQDEASEQPRSLRGQSSKASKQLGFLGGGVGALQIRGSFLQYKHLDLLV